MKQEIPIQNLYYLLTYAWDHFQPGEMQDIASEDCPDLANLFAKVLACGLKHLTRRGLDREYVPHTEELSRLRGSFQLLASERRMSRLRGRMICDFDDLSHDVLHNQILRTTAHRLLSCTDLTPANRHALRLASDPLHHVSLIRITSATFGRVQLHRNNRAYRFLLNLCELIQRNLLPNEESGTHRFQDILRDEVVMHSLFEKFVRNFAARHCAGASVSAKQIAWHVTAADDALAQLPGMVTDVTIEWPERKLILDCKYYREALVARWKDKKLHSANLYQLLAYLQNQALVPGWDQVEGMLLYPSVGGSIDLHYTLLGRSVRAATLDLDQPWEAIHAQMLDLLNRRLITTKLNSPTPSPPILLELEPVSKP